MIKRSRQREAIRQCLTGRYDHPTAETVYMSIKDEFPNISLGTVYRNLSLLSDLGADSKKLLSVEARTDLTETRHRITTFLQRVWMCDGSGHAFPGTVKSDCSGAV